MIGDSNMMFTFFLCREAKMATCLTYYFIAETIESNC